MSDIDQLAKVLAQRLRGEVRLDHESLEEAARDFGGVARGEPRIVAWPEDTDDVVAVVRTARETGTRLAVRGAGHSQGGQALCQGGIVVQTQRLNAIEAVNASEGSIRAGAGTLWRDLVDAVIPHELLPVVLTDHLGVTLGGTLAVAGLGPASFRRGAQIDHCTSVECVLGTGDVVSLGGEQQPALVQHILGGLGQFGVVTKVGLRLRPAPRFVRSYYLTYDNVQTFLTDAVDLMSRDSVHLLSGCALPSEHQGMGSSHDFVLTAATETDQPAPADGLPVLEGTSPSSWWHEDVSLRDYLTRLDATFEGYLRPYEKNAAHPWVEFFLPLAAVPEYVELVTRAFPAEALLLWPLRTACFRQPMLRLPEEKDVVLVGILCSRRETQLTEVLPRLKHACRRGAALGGTRYLSGWLDFDPDRWRQHYGNERWQEITSLRQQCDPDHLFGLWEAADRSS